MAERHERRSFAELDRDLRTVEEGLRAMTEVVARLQPVVEEGKRVRKELIPQLRQLLADDAYRARRHRESSSRWTSFQKLAVAMTGIGILAVNVATMLIALHQASGHR